MNRCWVFALAVACWTGGLHAQETFRLRETLAPGSQYHVSVRVDLSGNLSLPAEKGQAAPKPLTLTGSSAIEYDERLLAEGTDKKINKTVRYYQRIDFQRKVGNQLQQNTIRPEVRRLVLLRHQQVEVPFSPAGPMTWGEIDLVRTDVFTPALVGLMGDGPVRPGARWQASVAALQELTDLERVEVGSLTCTFDNVSTLAGRRQAKVSFTGNVRGLGEDGPTRHQLDGYYYFDLDSNHLSYLSMKGVQSLLDKSDKEVGKVEGTFVLTRQPGSARELSAEALRGLVLEPNDDNTLLLFDSPEMGIRFLYPRRWRASSVKDRQITLEESRGSGLLLTLEPLNRLPTGKQFVQEVNSWLNQQKATIHRSEPPRQLQGMEHFMVEATVGGQRVQLDYYVIRQQAAGATIAGRLAAADAAALQREVQRIAQSVRITRQP